MNELFPFVCFLESKVNYSEFKKRLEEKLKDFQLAGETGLIQAARLKMAKGSVLRSAVTMNSKTSAVLVFYVRGPEEANEIATKFNDIAEVDLRIGDVDYATR